jgi:STE24 endopeptidase
MAAAFALVFLAFLLLMLGLKFWLAARQIRHVTQHADTVPSQFATRVSLAAHQKAARYTVARQRLKLLETAFSALVLLALTFGGGLQLMAGLLAPYTGQGLLHQITVVAAVVLLTALFDLPFEWYRTFHIEQNFGFNRMTPLLFLIDLGKGVLLAIVVGLPLLALVLWLMEVAGALWWLYAWVAWVGWYTLLNVLAPTVIAPLFNKFEPLQDSALAARVQSLLERTGFASRGVFVMDGSRRSSHGNAYFAGLGRSKRVVFFDTLLQRLLPQEIEAVLAHELGHFKLRHIRQRIAVVVVASLGLLALLGWLAGARWFYLGLGVEPAPANNSGLALILFILILPVFSFVAAPVASLLSRRHEFQADRFAAGQTSAQDLANALVKLYNDNATTLTPDPLHSSFYDSHPPATVRIERLLAAA